ncbi:MAG: hypothetical protein LUE14_04140 [Clostridiales bacterium]|nr:hypothetical protein [Clostridiales bacterium]
MRERRFFPATAAVCAAAVAGAWLVLSYRDDTAQAMVYLSELIVCAGAGVVCVCGIVQFVNDKRWIIGGILVCLPLLLPVFLNPYLLAGYREIPYLFQVHQYLNRMMTVLCPFLAAGVFRAIVYVLRKRRMGLQKIGLTAAVYFPVMVLIIAVLQITMKNQYLIHYGYRTTWNWFETLCWVLCVDIVFMMLCPEIGCGEEITSGWRMVCSEEKPSRWQVMRCEEKSPGRRMMYREKKLTGWRIVRREEKLTGQQDAHEEKICGETIRSRFARKTGAGCAAAANAVCLIISIARSFHLREILGSIVQRNSTVGSVGLAEENAGSTEMIGVNAGNAGTIAGNSGMTAVDWVEYRLAVIRELFDGRFHAGESVRLSAFPEESPVSVLWSKEPLTGIGLAYGWFAAVLLLIVFVIMIAALFFAGTKPLIVNRAGRFVRLSIVLMTGLSLLSQLLLPVYGMYMPLMGDGSCAVFILCVYFLLFMVPGRPERQTVCRYCDSSWGCFTK